MIQEFVHDNTNLGKVIQDGLMMTFSVLCIKCYVQNNLNSVSNKLEFRPIIRLPIRNDGQLRNERRSNQSIQKVMEIRIYGNQNIWKVMGSNEVRFLLKEGENF